MFTHISHKVVIIMTILFQLDLIQQSMNEMNEMVIPISLLNYKQHGLE